MKRKKPVGGVKKKVKKFIAPRVSEVSRTSRTEKKCFDTTLLVNFVTIAAVPVPTLLNVPINGAELYQRVGRKISMKSIHIKARIDNLLTAVDQVGRIILFYDTNPNGVVPTVQNVLSDSNAGAATNAYSHINLANRARFKILRDKLYALPSLTNTAGVLTNYAMNESSDEAFVVNWFIPLLGMDSEFNGTNGGTIADIQTGALFIMALVDGVSASFTIVGKSRLRYFD